MTLLTLAGRFVAWLAGSYMFATYEAARVYSISQTSWLHRWFFTPFGVAAFTWGETIICQVVFDADADLLAHEYVHTLQARRYGVVFPLVYLWASLVAVLRGGHAYRDNRFEKEARGEKT